MRNSNRQVDLGKDPGRECSWRLCSSGFLRCDKVEYLRKDLFWLRISELSVHGCLV